jgi:hypothetical protein
MPIAQKFCRSVLDAKVVFGSPEQVGVHQHDICSRPRQLSAFTQFHPADDHGELMLAIRKGLKNCRVRSKINTLLVVKNWEINNKKLRIKLCDYLHSRMRQATIFNVFMFLTRITRKEYHRCMAH